MIHTQGEGGGEVGECGECEGGVGEGGEDQTWLVQTLLLE